jgi:two-component system chemotaxis response regulator CheY
MARKILAVDDSPTMRNMVSFTLKEAGCEVLEAGNGKDAMQLLETHSPVDLVITDLNMPVMDGFELITQLRSTTAHKFVPILILTTESEAAKKERGKAAGATGWIVKPFQPEKLMQVINKICP